MKKMSSIIDTISVQEQEQYIVLQEIFVLHLMVYQLNGVNKWVC